MKYDNKQITSPQKTPSPSSSPQSTAPSPGGYGEKAFFSGANAGRVVDRVVVQTPEATFITATADPEFPTAHDADAAARPNQLFVCLITDGHSYALTEGFDQRFLLLGKAGGQTVFFVNIGDPARCDEIYEGLRSKFLQSRDERDRVDSDKAVDVGEELERQIEMDKLAHLFNVEDDERPCLVFFLPNPVQKLCVVPVDETIVDAPGRIREFYRLLCDRVSEQKIQEVIGEGSIDDEETAGRLQRYLSRAVRFKSEMLVPVEIIDGDCSNGGRVKIDGHDLPLTPGMFDIFAKLVMERLKTAEGWVHMSELGMKKSRYQPMTHLCERLARTGVDPKQLIENGHGGKYRLSTLPELVRYPEALRGEAS